jgi:hypothetical protein
MAMAWLITFAMVMVIAALYYWVLLPWLQDLLGVQNEVEEMGPEKMPTPTVQSAAQSNLIPIVLTGCLVTYLAKQMFWPKKFENKIVLNEVLTNALN